MTDTKDVGESHGRNVSAARLLFYRRQQKKRVQNAGTVGSFIMNNLVVELGETKLQFLAGEKSCQVLERRRLDVDRVKGGAGIRAQMEQALPELVKTWQPAAVGVGFGGPVDWKAGRIVRSHQIEGWS